jgi:Planctomycete extracellular
MNWFSRKRSRPVTGLRLQLESLEDRFVPSTLDLTTHGAEGVLNGALFQQCDAQPTGTGVIRSFVRLQTNATTEQGYNTDARPLQFDENKSPQFTRSLALNSIPVVNVGGVPSYEFLLDINQNSKQPLLSLDDVKLFVGDQPNLNNYDPASGELAGATKVYDMNAGGGSNWVLLNYRLNTGSGSGDMLMYVPASWFDTGSATPYVYLFSKFGVNDSANAGFQEWATSNVPLNPTLSAITGTVMLAQGTEAGTVLSPLPNVFVFADFNGNGTFEPGTDLGMVTDINGSYSFSNILVTDQTAVKVYAEPNLDLPTQLYFGPQHESVLSQDAIFGPGQTLQLDPFVFTNT